MTPTTALTRLASRLPSTVRLTRREFERRQTAMVRVVLLHMPVLTLVALARGYGVGHLLLELSPIVAAALLSASTRLSVTARMASATIGLVMCSSLLVHATGGQIESHFHFFAVVMAVTLYQAWIPLLVCLGWVALHHGVLGLLDPRAIYSHAAAVARPLLWAGVHSIYILLAAAAAVMSWHLTARASLRAAQLLDATNDGVYGRDDAGRITFSNRATAQLLGRHVDDVVGHTDHDLLGHDGAMASCRVCAALDDGPLRLTEVDVVRCDGSWFRAQMSSKLLPGTTPEHAVTFRDVTLQRQQEAELRRRAMRDDLTGLANRALLMDRLDQALAEQEREPSHVVAVIGVDLDGFKQVNDAHGHDGGDHLLQQVAERLAAAVRPGDTAARTGGDEFVLLLTGLEDAAEAARIGERAIATVRRPFEIEGLPAHVGASAGLAVSECGDDPEKLLRDADVALYAAKAAGRNQLVRLDTELGHCASLRSATGRELRTAITDGQLVVHYQPEVDQRTLDVIGFEALVRWQHPERGLLPPAAFLGIAEETGLIVQLGAWVLRTACRQLEEWHVRDPARRLSMSVNVSAQQLTDSRIIPLVRQLLADASFAPEQLWLEITETALVNEQGVDLTVLRHLRALGVRLAMDDFGTGHSSLGSLGNLPVDVLKIDRSFIQGIDSAPAKVEMLRAVLAMADALGLQVVTEGIETDGELDVLRRLEGQVPGAERIVQGFLFARPGAPEQDPPRRLAPTQLVAAPTS